MHIFERALRKDLENGEVALVLGAGVSAALSGGNKLSTWSGLLKDGLNTISDVFQAEQEMAQGLLASATTGSQFLLVGHYVGSTFRDHPGEYAAWLYNSIGQLRVVDRTLAEALPQTKYWLTTNYDNLLEEASGREALVWTDDEATNEFSRSEGRSIFHVHGYYKKPSSVVLSGEDYGRLQENGHVQELLRTLARTHSLLFIGFGAGIDDPNFSRLTEWLHRTQGASRFRHYMLVSATDNDLFNRDERLKQRLAPVIYGDRHSDLPSFLYSLRRLESDSGRPPPSEPHPGATAVVDTSGYAQLFDGHLPAGLVAELEARLGDFSALHSFQREALALCLRVATDRTPGLICAVTGTGKTTIARIAINVALARGKSGIFLLPTKALVTQESKEWDSWQEAWKRSSDRRLRIYPASRDFPENDRPVSRGRYEVAVAIYEKLGVYLVSGRTPLTNTAVAVVDELQMLLEGSNRSAKLEAILTSLRLIPNDERPAVLGLSATLPPESTRALRRWLGVSDEMLLTTNERPVPLDSTVVDLLGWKTQPDAHLYNIPGQVPPPSHPSAPHDLSKRLNASRAALFGKVNRAPNGEFAATLIDWLLEQDSERRVLCFVPSRSAALEVSSAIQALLKKRSGALRKGSPWLHGRFADETRTEEAEKQYLSLKYSDLPNSDDVLRGLREGVAAHTAALPARLRRLLEEEFVHDSGLLRVLVATDTLAVGVNLPADTVVATSVSGYGGGGSREGRLARQLLSPSNLDNKAGRAGRRGKTRRSRGEFYLLVPSATELQDIEGLSAGDIRRLSSIDGIFDAYVTAPRRSSQVSSMYRTVEQVSSLVLQVLCQDGFAREPAAWTRRVDDVLQNLLMAHEEGVQVPRAAEVYETLLAQDLIGVRPSGKIAISGLGVAVARSSLDLHVATTLERLGRLAAANAGVVDLLWNACRSEDIQATTNWVSLPPVARKHYPSLKDAVLAMARSYCSPSELLRRSNTHRLKHGKLPPLETLVEEGSVVVSKELTELLAQDGESAADADITALLRALIAFEWSRGIPFSEIKARYSRSIRSEEWDRGRPVELRVYYADVQQLCEQIAGLVGGASDISYSTDGFDFSARVRNLANEVEFGLPAWLAPIARMRIPTLHRERLTFLWNRPPPEEGLGALLDSEELRNRRGISASELDEAKRHIELKEEENRNQRNRVAQRWANVMVPGGDGDIFEDVSDRLDEAANSIDYLAVLTELFEGMDLLASAVDAEDYFSRTSISSKSGTGDNVVLFVPHKGLSQEAVEAVRFVPGLVVMSQRVLPGAVAALNRPTKARFLQPEHVLSFLANLVDSRGSVLDPDEVIDGLSRIAVSSVDSDSWYLYDPDALEAPPPFVGSLPKLDRMLNLQGADEDLQD